MSDDLRCSECKQALTAEVERDHYRTAVDSVSADARARCDERDTIESARYHWERAAIEWQASAEKLRAENTRLLDCGAMAAGIDCTLDTGCVACLASEVAARERENTPLRERVTALEKQLSGVMEQVESWERNAVAWRGKTSLSAADTYAGCARVLRFILGKPSGTEPAVTGTTSDKTPIRKPAGEPHAFKAHPWGHDVCDAKVDDHGRPRTCARPQAEHGEDWIETPCSCGTVQNCWVKIASHQTIDGVKHRKESCARG